MRPTVVLCHGSSQSKDWGFFPELAERLARAGFAVASFSFVNPPPEPVQQLGLILDSLRVDTCGLLGYEGGGAVALERGATDGRVGAVVTWNAPPAVIDAVGPVRVPWLVMHDTALEQALRASIDWFMRHLP